MDGDGDADAAAAAGQHAAAWPAGGWGRWVESYPSQGTTGGQSCPPWPGSSGAPALLGSAAAAGSEGAAWASPAGRTRCSAHS